MDQWTVGGGRRSNVAVNCSYTSQISFASPRAKVGFAIFRSRRNNNDVRLFIANCVTEKIWSSFILTTRLIWQYSTVIISLLFSLLALDNIQISTATFGCTDCAAKTSLLHFICPLRSPTLLSVSLSVRLECPRTFGCLLPLPYSIFLSSLPLPFHLLPLDVKAWSIFLS